MGCLILESEIVDATKIYRERECSEGYKIFVIDAFECVRNKTKTKEIKMLILWPSNVGRSSETFCLHRTERAFVLKISSISHNFYLNLCTLGCCYFKLETVIRRIRKITLEILT